jgi:hypothetical protein
VTAVGDDPAQVRVRVASGPDVLSELASLRSWLSLEEELRGRITDELAPPRPETMGLASDTLVVALGGGGALSILAHSLSVWLQHRRSDVTVEIDFPDGRSVKAAVLRTSDSLAVIEKVLAAGSTEDNKEG